MSSKKNEHPTLENIITNLVDIKNSEVKSSDKDLLIELAKSIKRLKKLIKDSPFENIGDTILYWFMYETNYLINICELDTEQRKKRWLDWKKIQLEHIEQTEIALNQMKNNRVIAFGLKELDKDKLNAHIDRSRKFVQKQKETINKEIVGPHKYIIPTIRNYLFISMIYGDSHKTIIEGLYQIFIHTKYENWHRLDEENVKERIRKTLVDPYLVKIKNKHDALEFQFMYKWHQTTKIHENEITYKIPDLLRNYPE